MEVVELLVHVSGKQQDDQYRQMAAAYADFELEHTTDLTRPNLTDESSALGVSTPTAVISRPFDELPTDATTPSLLVHLERDPNASPQRQPLFSELTQFPITATPGFDSPVNFGAPQSSEVTVKRHAAEPYISDTPRAIAALASQLWTSSLAIQADEEHVAGLYFDEEATAPLVSVVPTRTSQESPTRVLEKVDTASESSLTGRIATDDSEEDNRRQSALRASLDAMSALNRERANAEQESRNRNVRRTATVANEHDLRRRESSSSPIPPPPESVASVTAMRRVHTVQSFVGPGTPSVASSTPGTPGLQTPNTASKPFVVNNIADVVAASTPALPVAVNVISNTTPVMSVSTPAPSAPALRTPASSLKRPTARLPATPTTSTTLAPLALPPSQPPRLLSLIHQTFHITRPPSPPISSLAAPESHITPPLQHLYTKFAAVQPPRYAAVLQTRPLRPLERGYWFVPASTTTLLWEPQLRKDFWDWLQEFVGSGQAGWGVSSVRVAAEHWHGVGGRGGDVNGNADVDVEMDMGDEQIWDLRVYCWGEVVEHIYYLLFVASRSKVKMAGLQWLDGAGEVVIQMP